MIRCSFFVKKWKWSCGSECHFLSVDDIDSGGEGDGFVSMDVHANHSASGSVVDVHDLGFCALECHASFSGLQCQTVFAVHCQVCNAGSRINDGKVCGGERQTGIEGGEGDFHVCFFEGIEEGAGDVQEEVC